MTYRECDDNEEAFSFITKGCANELKFFNRIIKSES